MALISKHAVGILLIKYSSVKMQCEHWVVKKAVIFGYILTL